jgi:predicted ferric reductase
VSIYITGRGLDRLAARAGQHFRWRFLARDGWWRSHPFSLSAAPNGQYLRLTIKELGDWTSRLQFIHPGTRVFAEGPYGTFTGERRTRQNAVLIAGGIGITPLRAIVEELPAQRVGLTLLYRATSPGDVIFRDELEALVHARGATLHMLVGRREELPVDPLGPTLLRQLVPDIRDRDVFVCGPEGMVDHVLASLGRLGVPTRQVHSERFAF